MDKGLCGERVGEERWFEQFVVLLRMDIGSYAKY